MREINQNSLLNLIRVYAPVPRQTLVSLSGLSSATVIGITNDLIEEEIVQESGVAESTTRGPKPTLLEIRPDGRYAIGIKVTENETISVILNLNGDVVYSERLSISPHSTQQHLLVLLNQGVKGLVERSTLPKNKFIGVGCGLPGLIDPERGRCIRSWHLELENFAISGPLAKELGIPVYIDNDVSCLAIYEKLFGQKRSYRHLAVVSIGSGIGAGLIINGDLYRGAIGGAGELGHIVVAENGRTCACGKHGCLEAYASDYGIIATYLEEAEHSSLPNDQTAAFAMVLERARAGDSAACNAFNTAGYFLGVGLSHLVNLFNPECILLTGPNITAWDQLSPSLEQSLYTHSLTPLPDSTHIVSEPLEYTAWARGAASLVLRQFYLPPSASQEFHLI